MWQQPQTVLRWLPSALALVLLSACSQAIAPRSEVLDSSPIAAQPEPIVTPSLLPTPSSTVAPVRKATPTEPSIARIPEKPRSSPAPVAKALPLERTPTFRAMPRMAGFSPDSNYFVYLESSRDTGAGVPKSALQLVNVATNRCVENGCIETRYGEKEANNDTTATEADLLKQTWKVRQELNLTPPVAGTELAILSRSRSADGSETVTVRLNDDSQPLRLQLHQTLTPDKAAMQLEAVYNGQQRSLDSLNNFRSNVLDYSIRQVRLSPDGKRIAVLITATKPTFEGTLGTTLVQGFAL